MSRTDDLRAIACDGHRTLDDQPIGKAFPSARIRDIAMPTTPRRLQRHDPSLRPAASRRKRPLLFLREQRSSGILAKRQGIDDLDQCCSSVGQLRSGRPATEKSSGRPDRRYRCVLERN
jgi:hypothetical protein